MEFVQGTWKYDSSENDDAIAAAMGIPAEAHKKMQENRPLVTVTLEGTDTLVAKSVYTDNTIEHKFKLGVPTKVKTPMGHESTVTMCFENGILKEKHEFESGMTLNMEKVITADTTKMKMCCKDVVSYQVWKKQ